MKSASDGRNAISGAPVEAASRTPSGEPRIAS
jgi:hypothetical protein